VQATLCQQSPGHSCFLEARGDERSCLRRGRCESGQLCAGLYAANGYIDYRFSFSSAVGRVPPVRYDRELWQPQGQVRQYVWF
jgi:hypothetical protein